MLVVLFCFCDCFFRLRGLRGLARGILSAQFSPSATLFSDDVLVQIFCRRVAENVEVVVLLLKGVSGSGEGLDGIVACYFNELPPPSL